MRSPLPVRTRSRGVPLRAAALLGGGAALLACLVVAQAFLPVLRRQSAPPPVGLSASSISPPPTLPPAPPASPFAAVMDHAAAGRFPAALARLRDLPPDQAAAALASLFALWAHRAPAEAAAAALALTDPAARDRAWQAVVATWSVAAPAELAAHSLTLPESEDAARRHALDAAVGHWLALDAPAAMDWVGRLPSSPATDGAVALVAQQPDLLQTQPDLALSWAESVQDPALRSRVLGRVVRAWRDSTPAALAAAEYYARTSPDLLPSEREDILVGERFTAHP